MNRVYKVIWNNVRGCYVVASEFAKAYGKNVTRMVLATLVSGSLFSGAAIVEAAAIINGDRCVVTGNLASAMGYMTHATGFATLAVGNDTTASGDNSFAMGVNSVASGNTAIVMGAYAKATRDDAIAMGWMAEASNYYAIALGYETKASGKNSIAMGIKAQAKGENSLAAIGGTSDIGAKNSVAIGVGAKTLQVNTFAIGVGAQAEAENAFALGNQNTATGKDSSALGYQNTAIGDSSSALGYQNTATSNSSSALGNQNTASGLNSSAIGFNNKTYTDNSVAMGNWSVAGLEDGDDATNALAIGAGDEEHKTVAGGKYSTAIGYNTMTSAESAAAIGYSNTATGANSSAFGNQNTATDENSSAIGYSNTASSANSSAFGYQNTAAGENSSAIGYENTATGKDSSAFGRNNMAQGFYSTAIGYKNTATGANSSAIGYENTASGLNSSAIGRNNTAYGSSTTAMGSKNTARGFYSTAIGYENTASAYYSTAIGYKNTAYTVNSVAMGNWAEAGLENSIDRTAASNALAIGAGDEEHKTVARGAYSTAVGYDNKVYTDYSVALGSYAVAGLEDGDDAANATNAIAIGAGDEEHKTIASGKKTIAIGYNSVATGENSVAIGAGAIAGALPIPVEYTYMGTKISDSFAGKSPLAVVSVGAEGSERLITNVAAGRITATSTDAINGSQLWYVADSINTRINDVIAGMPVVDAGNNTKVDVKSEPLPKEPPIVKAAAPEPEQSSPRKEPTEVLKNTYKVSAWDTTVGVVAGEDNIIVTPAIDEIGMTRDYKLALNKNLKLDSVTAADITAVNGTIDNITAKDIKTDTLKATDITATKAAIDKIATKVVKVGGNVTIDDKGMSITDGPSITMDGVDAGDKKITNVAPGVGSTDAVNFGQLTNVENNLENKITHMSNRVDRVGATAAALAALHPLAEDEGEKLSVAVGTGTYRDKYAGALGMFYRPTDRVMFSLGGSKSGSETMANLGMTFALDKNVSGISSKAAMVSEIKELKAENAFMKDKLVAQDEKLAKQDAEIAELKQMVQALIKK